MERRTFSDQQQQEVTKTKGDETKNLTAEEKDRLGTGKNGDCPFQKAIRHRRPR